MVQSAVSVVGVLVSLCTLIGADQTGCNSTLCFRLFSRRINVDFNLFDNAVAPPIESYIQQLGYPVESHQITTEDGYILTYHRIPHGKSSTDLTGKRKPVLLQHGLLGASSCWLLSSDALGYYLADAGYDVWLGNSRGNTYSRRHKELDPDVDKSQFWDFSWHEMGNQDLPASIDYILNVTGQQRLFYIGHSMGTTMYFVLGATKPEYMDKVEAMVAMAPVAFPWNIRSPLTNFFSNIHTVINTLATIMGKYEVFPYSKSLLWVQRNICSSSTFKWLSVCEEIMKFIGGFNEQELKRTPLQTVLQYMPAGASFKTFKHFRQIIQTDFKYFDKGYWGNYRSYSSLSPPLYNLSSVNSPIYVYYAENDWLSVPEDVDHVVEHLPNVKEVNKIADENFNHLDFMWANDAKPLLYHDIVSALKKM